LLGEGFRACLRSVANLNDHRPAQSQGYGLRGRRVSGNFLWNDGDKVRALIALVGLRFPVCSPPVEGPDYDQNSSQA
jgi:hypothetical protein